jgi:hypothetical protein
MAFELIITSVRKGLDGGSGEQPVLRTKDLAPEVAERLQLRSGYPHPFAHGDRRNPIVSIHRIERVAGTTFHVIAQIRDAGSDHTGRSNFLAHFVTLDEAEARRKSAGPVEVTKRFPFRPTWAEPPREVDPPTIIGGDRSPGPCRAWNDAGLDPAIAGDLAEAAMKGREVMLVTRPGDDVLALFADAMALVAPAKRWQVTFNTCEIEPFDATWRAVRGDLPQAKAARAAPGAIDLTVAGARGTDGPYARCARDLTEGKAAALPWQESARPAKAEVVETGGQDGSTAVLDETVVTVPGPPKGGELTPTLTGRLPGKKRPPGRRIEWDDDAIETEVRPSTLERLVRPLLFAVVVLLIGLGGGLVWVARDPELQRQWRLRSADATSIPDPKGESARSGVSDAADAAMEKLKADLQREKDAEKQKQRAIEQEQERLALEQKRKDEEKRQADEAHDRQMAEEEKKQAAERRKERERDAFASLAKMPSIVVQDLVVSGIDGTKTPEVDLGGFDFAALVNPTFELAIPKEQVDGGQFNAWVDPGEGQAGSWLIKANGRDVDGPGQSIQLATITARDGTLRMKAANDAVARNTRFKLLRRSVLLVKARDPEKPDAPAQVRQRIQLLRPAAGIMEFEVSLLDGVKNLNPPRPAGVTAAKEVSSEPPQYPLDCEMDYEVRFDYPLKFDGGGGKSPVTYAGTLVPETAAFCQLLACPPSKDREGKVVRDRQAVVGLDFAFSPKAGVLRIAPDVQGKDKHLFDLAEIAPILARTEAEFEEWTKKLTLDLKADCNRIVNTPLQRFRSSAAEKEMFALAKKYRAELNTFLEQRGPYQPSQKKGDCFDQWFIDCQQIQRELNNLPEPGTRKSFANGLMVTDEEHRAAVKDVDDKWTRIFREPVKQWFEALGEMMFRKHEEVRKAFSPLKTPVRIVITRLTSPAYTTAGEKHDVVLALPVPKQPGEAGKPQKTQAKTSFD